MNTMKHDDKLKLKRETLRELSITDLAQVAGGGSSRTCGISSNCCQ